MISSSASLSFKNFFNSTAPAVLIAGLILLRGFPSRAILTKESNMLNLGLISLKSLLEIFKVLSWYKVHTESGNAEILLLCKSRTVRFGHLSKFYIDCKLLKPSKSWSSFFEVGIESNVPSKLFWWRSSITKLFKPVNASFSMNFNLFLEIDKSLNCLRLMNYPGI